MPKIKDKIGCAIQFILCLAALLVFIPSSCLFFSSGDEDPSPAPGTPINAAAGVTFKDIDAGAGEIAGLLSIDKAADESDVTGYVLYWGGTAGTKLAGEPAVAEYPVSEGGFTRFFSPDTPVPQGATHFIVFTKNAAGEMTTGTSCAADTSGTAYTEMEGTQTAPVFLEASMGGTSYTKQIGSGKSYYRTTPLGMSLYISVRGLSDDVDLIGYGSDPSFSSEVERSCFGRTAEDILSPFYMEGTSGGGDIFYYFVVDGGSTGYKLNAPGAAFTITVQSHNGEEVMISSVGTPESPVNLLAGVVQYSMVDGTSYYRVSAVAGTSYYCNVSPGMSPVFYTDRFSTPAPGLPVTAAEDSLYLTVSGGSSTFKLEIVCKEGTPQIPVYLKNGKDSYCQTAGVPSYYSFDVIPGHPYTINLCEIPKSFDHDFDLHVFQGEDFSGTPAASSATAADPETCVLTATGNTLSVRVDDISGNGGVFTLRVE
jgi:hypothetical protein